MKSVWKRKSKRALHRQFFQAANHTLISTSPCINTNKCMALQQYAKKRKELEDTQKYAERVGAICVLYGFDDNGRDGSGGSSFCAANAADATSISFVLLFPFVHILWKMYYNHTHTHTHTSKESEKTCTIYAKWFIFMWNMHIFRPVCNVFFHCFLLLFHFISFLCCPLFLFFVPENLRYSMCVHQILANISSKRIKKCSTKWRRQQQWQKHQQKQNEFRPFIQRILFLCLLSLSHRFGWAFHDGQTDRRTIL